MRQPGYRRATVVASTAAILGAAIASAPAAASPSELRSTERRVRLAIVVSLPFHAREPITARVWAVASHPNVERTLRGLKC